MTIVFNIKCNTCNNVLSVKVFLYDKKSNIAKFLCPSCSKMICIHFGDKLQISGGIECPNRGFVIETFGVEDRFKNKQSLSENDNIVVTNIQDHYPDLYLKEKRSIALLLDEESSNPMIQNIAKIHSSITDSPTQYLNTIPNSIIDIWRKECYTSNFVSKTDRIGEKICEVIGDNAITSITSNVKQMFFLSDVPVEWIRVGDCPLAFAYDVCRLPISNEQFHRQYLEDLNKKDFHVKKDIIENTLVLMCCYEDVNLKKIDEKIIDSFKDINFSNYKICKTVHEFKDIIEKEKPLFLIVDCHGNYDCDEDGDFYSYLQVGKERLISEDIDALSYVPPLIFLSACNIRPPQKVDQCIADALIRRGSLAVTASYVELDVRQGFYTIVRIVHNLKNASQMGVHSNWLSFIAHCIRTFLQQTAYTNQQHDFYKKGIPDLKEDLVKIKDGDEVNAKYYESIIEDLEKIERIAKANADSYEIKTMKLLEIYDGPKKQYAIKIRNLNRLKQYGYISAESYKYEIEKLFNEVYSVQLYNIEHSLICCSVPARKYLYSQWINLAKGNIEAEFLCYTNYGRMDMIPFDSYIERINERMKTPSNFKEELRKQSIEILQKNSLRSDMKDACWCGSGRKYIYCHGQKK